jgi:hypothetical protein
MPDGRHVSEIGLTTTAFCRGNPFMDSRLRSDLGTDGPSFSVALVAVLAGGIVSSWISTLFFGFAPYLTHTVWVVLTSIFGAYGLKFVLRLLGYEIGLVAAVGALALGSIVGVGLASAVPGMAGPGLPVLPAFGMFSGIGSLLLSAWIVQNTAHSPGRTA